MQHLLTYVFVVYNGDANVMIERRTVLTCFEERCMHSEYRRARTLMRVIDVYKNFRPIPRYIRRAVRLKYSIECHDRNSWPKYVSYKEDKKTKYYDQNCFKGGIFTQLSGWLGTADLWTSTVSDTDFH